MHWAAIGSQCKLMNSGVTCVLFGSLKINLAAAFWYLMLLTQIPESIIHNNSSSVKSVLFWIRREICTDQNSSKLICVWFNVRDNNRCTYSLRKSYYGLVLELKCLNAGFVSAQDDNWWTVDYCDVFILTAPIHLLLRHISTSLMKKQTHPDLVWNECELVFSNCSFMDELTVPSSHFASEVR